MRINILTSCMSLLLSVPLICGTQHYYETLQVSRAASQDEIRASYKHLSKILHPDKTGGVTDEEYIRLHRAYKVLSNPQLRQKYDQYGEAAVKEEMMVTRTGSWIHLLMDFDVTDTVHSFIRRLGHMVEPEHVPSTVYNLRLTLAEVYNGTEKIIPWKQRNTCHHCGGTGGSITSMCPSCDGAGVVLLQERIIPGFTSEVYKTCDQCAGRGKVTTGHCPHCEGKGFTSDHWPYTLYTPKGVPNNYNITFWGSGEESPGREAGDLVIVVTVDPDSNGWIRKGDHLYRKETIRMDEAFYGFERRITHLDNHTVALSRRGVTSPGNIDIVPGEGMPVFQETRYGDLYVEYVVEVPKMTAEDRNRFVELIDSSHEDL